MHQLICGNCLELLPTFGHVNCLIADPPDAIDLKYNSYEDCMTPVEYREFLWNCLNLFVEHADISWVSYNAKWTFMMGSLVCDLLEKYPELEAKAFVQTYTFGQNRKTDCGNGHRPLLRLRHKGAKLYPEQVKVPSWRQLHGDKRAAAGGRVPLDHWDFPRVTGNSKQRRAWHPTQLHEGLIERCIKLSTPATGSVLDIFSGTGTTLRVCRRLGLDCTAIELDSFYCEKIAKDNGMRLISRGTWYG